MSHIETYRNTLIYALAIVGNERLLAERLGVKVGQVLNWVMGIELVPADIFLKSVDVVLEATVEDIARSRERLSKLKLRADVGMIDALRGAARHEAANTPRDDKASSDDPETQTG